MTNSMKRKRKKKQQIIISENKCDTKCIYFPQNVDKNIEYEIRNGVKYRINKVPYICNYDGHKIIHFCPNCPYKKTFKELKYGNSNSKR